MTERLYTASEVLMLMLDCGTSAAQLYGEVPGFKMQADFILSSNDELPAKRLAFHSLLLNVASKILTDYTNVKDEHHAKESSEPVDCKEQEDADDARSDED